MLGVLFLSTSVKHTNKNKNNLFEHNTKPYESIKTKKCQITKILAVVSFFCFLSLDAVRRSFHTLSQWGQKLVKTNQNKMKQNACEINIKSRLCAKFISFTMTTQKHRQQTRLTGEENLYKILTKSYTDAGTTRTVCKWNSNTDTRNFSLVKEDKE